MITYGSTIKGMRKENQDRYLIYSPSNQITFVAIADGMGGAVGGGIASKLIVERIEKVIKVFFEDWNIEHSLKNILQNIFIEAQSAVRQKIIKEPELSGMGSTLCCLLIVNEKYVWGNIGDSRIYHFANDKFSKITKDHTQLEEFVAKDNNNTFENITRTYGHILTRTINGGNDIPDIYPETSPYQILNRNEGFLLCSDGLLLDKYGNDEKRFLEYLTEADQIKEFVENLITDSYEGGSADNITCVACFNELENPYNIVG